MARRWQLALGGLALAIVLMIIGVPGWVLWLVVLAAIAVPVAGYLMLDPSQRRRLKAARRRGQLRR